MRHGIASAEGFFFFSLIVRYRRLLQTSPPSHKTHLGRDGSTYLALGTTCLNSQLDVDIHQGIDALALSRVDRQFRHGHLSGVLDDQTRIGS